MTSYLPPETKGSKPSAPHWVYILYDGVTTQACLTLLVAGPRPPMSVPPQAISPTHGPRKRRL